MNVPDTVDAATGRESAQRMEPAVTAPQRTQQGEKERVLRDPLAWPVVLALRLRAGKAREMEIGAVNEIGAAGVSEPVLIPRPRVDFNQLIFAADGIPFKLYFGETGESHFFQQSQRKLNHLGVFPCLDNATGTESFRNLQYLPSAEGCDKLRMGAHMTGRNCETRILARYGFL